ncbi:hypothetical protein [Streptococcus catagoni]|uniref:hypothetical protein n=1 Tax=Streptococcus catagoni TaxID=2654874 RepID=UPI0014093F91|nr:hypothetical protein [Streptococcus catagoni]
MAVQEIPKRLFKQIVGSGTLGSITFFRDLVIGQFYILSVDAYSFDAGRDVDIYKIISSTQADVYRANKNNYQSPSALEPGVPEYLPKSNLKAVYVNDKEIASVWYDGTLIYKKVVTSFIKKTIRVAGSLDIRESTNSMYLYALVGDVDRTLIGSGDIKAVYINNVKLADGAKVDFTKANTYYLITITQLSNVERFVNHSRNTIAFAF